MCDKKGVFTSERQQVVTFWVSCFQLELKGSSRAVATLKTPRLEVILHTCSDVSHRQDVSTAAHTALKCTEIQSRPSSADCASLSTAVTDRQTDSQFRLLQKCGLHLGGGGPRACWKWSASLDNSPTRGWKICPANQYPLIKTMACGQRQAEAGGSSISLYVCQRVCEYV